MSDDEAGAASAPESDFGGFSPTPPSDEEANVCGADAGGRRGSLPARFDVVCVDLQDFDDSEEDVKPKKKAAAKPKKDAVR